VLGSNEELVLRRVRAVNALAAECGTTPSRFALAWVLRNPRVATAISGASSVDQLEENLAALDFTQAFGPELLDRIERARVTP
jgi:aryl-alcohol dehydrogenase-like predicted oxidoreductase